MSICTVPLHTHILCATTSNVQRTDTSYRSRLNCSEVLDPTDDQAVNSKLLVWQQKMHESQRHYGELVEMTVDDICSGITRNSGGGA